MTGDESAKRNRLAAESSPYLLQHAANPVDWFPWGEEAFAKARAEEKPVFLSIGYSTCHWCHVMERESFENEEIARLLSERFVAIKVDREERPDVDHVYMAAVQAVTGRGGWPLSVFLTPSGRPFWGGTYFPPQAFLRLLDGIATAWRTKRDDLAGDGDRLTEHLGSLSWTRREGEPGEETLAAAEAELAGSFDGRHGGFGPAPKFPRCHVLSFLLRRYARTGEEATLGMVTRTLDAMTRGGVYDHLGGGFHRYSTDPVWLVPHFEKMLYDQALAARSLVETFAVTGEERFADVARDVFRYVFRDLADEGGGFRSAEDADSEGVEGRFYVFTRAEVREVLGEEDAAVFERVYGVLRDGNWREESTGGATGTNILHRTGEPSEVAAAAGLPVEDLAARLASMREKLLAVRSRRIRPLLDDKVLADWNGLMIATLAYAGRVLDDAEYVRAAERAADFVLGHLVRDGRLLHRWRGGEAGIPGFLDDHAFLAYGLLELYEATFDARWLAEAMRLASEMVRLFRDEEEGGFHFTGSDGEALVSRTKEVYDGAVPSGNSVAALVLLRLGRLTGDAGTEELGRETIRAFAGHLAQMASGYPFLLMALDFAVGPASEIVLAGDPADPGLEAMRREVHSRFLPRAVLALNPDGEAGERARELIPFLASQPPAGGAATAYVCEGYACREPVTDVAALRELLDATKR